MDMCRVHGHHWPCDYWRLMMDEDLPWWKTRPRREMWMGSRRHCWWRLVWVSYNHLCRRWTIGDWWIGGWRIWLLLLDWLWERAEVRRRGKSDAIWLWWKLT